MSLATHGFDLPIMPGSISPVLHLSQYDDARTFTAHLKDGSGNPFTLPSGASAKLEGMNCKGVTFEQACAVSGSDITFTPKEAATDQPGLIAATLHIKSGNENISTLAVILNVQKAGATKEDVARDPGFVDALRAAVSAWLDDHDPIFTLPEGGEAGQALLSDGADGAFWGEAGIPSAVKIALMNVVRAIGVWSDGNAQSHIDDLYNALYPESPVPPVSPYEFYDFIQYTGETKLEQRTNQITTKTFENLNALIIDFDFIPKVSVSSATAIMGGQVSNGSSSNISFYGRTDTKRVSAFSHGAALGIDNISTIAVDSVSHVNLNPHSASPSTLTVDSSAISVAWANSNVINCPIGYFATYGTHQEQTNIYNFAAIGVLTLRDLNNTVVAKYRPAKRRSDNVIGIYDEINDEFCTIDSNLSLVTVGNSACVYDVWNQG